LIFLFFDPFLGNKHINFSDFGQPSINCDPFSESSIKIKSYENENKITSSMIKVLIGICYVNLASNACFSVLASFFDKVSEEKGASKSEVGLIFGIFAGVNVIVSPLLGKYSSYIGINFMFIGGIVLAAGCTILFSFVNLIKGHKNYLIFCFLIRSRIPKKILKYFFLFHKFFMKIYFCQTNIFVLILGALLILRGCETLIL
jgi:MFS family permease